MEGVGGSIAAASARLRANPLPVLATGACVVALALSLVWRGPALLSRTDGIASESSGLDYADRDIAGGNGVIVDQAAAYMARAMIPENASYRVLVDKRVPDATDLTKPFAWLYYQYFLIPRRQRDDARWIVCIGCNLARDAPAAHELWHDDQGISIARSGP